MIKIRRYKDSDYSSVIKNLKEADMFRSDLDSRDTLAGMISSNPDSILIAANGKDIIGSVYLIENPFHCFIFRLVVKKTERNKGIGKMLLESAEDILRKKGHKHVQLFVRETELERLKPFYEKMGYNKLPLKHQIFFKKLSKN